MYEYDQLVEANLQSIAGFPKTKRVELVFIDTGNVRWQLIAEGVEDLLVSDFLLNNIVDRVVPFDRNATSRDELERSMYFLMRREPLNEKARGWEPLQERMDAIYRGELVYLEIEAVYGAQVALVAKAITLSS